MERMPTRLDGPMLFRPVVHRDSRGFFVESYRESELEGEGVIERFIQDNHSRSSYGVVRGMHFQLEPPAAKLVRAARGAIVDVLVDIRPDSPSFGEWEAYELSEDNMHLLYVPVGFAHGFCVISDVADVLYKQSAYWSAESDRGFAVNDPDVGIDWPVPPAHRVISERDLHAPPLADVAPALRAG
jgi:dTDP-4-dehydrorhamnose 3,5-epimerase